MELDVTWLRAVQVWWALFWRSLAYTVVPAGLFGGIVGAVLAVNKIPAEPHLWKVQVVCGVAGIFIGIWITKIILSKGYPGFRIALVAAGEADNRILPSGQAADPNSGAPAA